MIKHLSLEQQIAKRIGYEFQDIELITRAITHRSAGGGNYERLEFLGDSVLGFVIAEQLYLKYPDVKEGDLTRLRAALVRRETLAEIAIEYEFGDLMILGSGELKSGGFRRQSILSDIVEAILGAVFLEAGIEKAKEIILKFYASRLAHSPDFDALKDPKTRLQEHLQGRKEPVPLYELKGSTGEAHNQIFEVSCTVLNGKIVTIATGKSRRKAEQEAAISCYKKIIELDT